MMQYRNRNFQQINMRGGDTRYELISHENDKRAAAGERMIGGNLLFLSIDEVHAQIDQEIRIAEANAEYDAKCKAREEAAAKFIAERDASMNEWLSTMPPMMAGRARKTLTMPMGGPQQLADRRGYVEYRVSQGWTVASLHGVRILQEGDENVGAYITANKLTNCAMDYAEWLIAKKVDFSCTGRNPCVMI